MEYVRIDIRLLNFSYKLLLYIEINFLKNLLKIKKIEFKKCQVSCKASSAEAEQSVIGRKI